MIRSFSNSRCLKKSCVGACMYFSDNSFAPISGARFINSHESYPDHDISDAYYSTCRVLGEDVKVSKITAVVKLPTAPLPCLNIDIFHVPHGGKLSIDSLVGTMTMSCHGTSPLFCDMADIPTVYMSRGDTISVRLCPGDSIAKFICSVTLS